MSFDVGNLGFAYESGHPILDSISFTMQENQILCILGPSGCGKTTLFRLLAGSLRPDNGQIGNGFLQPKSFLFQEPRLFGHLTVTENLALTTPAAPDRSTRIDQMLEAVGLLPYRHHFPDELSGGMQQRLSVVRAFLFPSNLMFLDEPFKSLDFKNRLGLVDAFRALYEKAPKTVLIITHDALDAALLADRILLLSEKPTHVLDGFENPVPREDRHPENPAVGALLSRIWAT